MEFWSSVEYGTFLKGLVREFLQVAKTEAAPPPPSGLLAPRSSLPAPAAQARQRFAVAETDYRQARGTLARLAMRWRCYAGYPWQLRRRIRGEAAPAALVVCTNTFYAPWVAMRAARARGIPVVHWMFDLFPDVLVLAGKVKPGSLAERVLRRWVRAMFDGAAANVFLGERLLAYAETKFGPIPRAVVIPVGCDAAPFSELEPKARKSERECGNQESRNGGTSLLAGEKGDGEWRGSVPSVRSVVQPSGSSTTDCTKCTESSAARSGESGAKSGNGELGTEETGNRKLPAGGPKERGTDGLTQRREEREGRKAEDQERNGECGNQESRNEGGGGERLPVTSGRCPETGDPRSGTECGNPALGMDRGRLARPTRANENVAVLYCGNFGRMHEVDTVVEALRAGVPAGVQLSFRGNGAGFQTLAGALAALPAADRILLGGNLPEAEWLAAMAAADIALVTMKAGAEGIVMPSKTYSAMAAGQAILAVCPRESDLADTVLRHDCGWVIEPGDGAGLRALLGSLPGRADEVLAKRRRAWTAARECYDQKVLAQRWAALFAQMNK